MQDAVADLRRLVGGIAVVTHAQASPAHVARIATTTARAARPAPLRRPALGVTTLRGDELSFADIQRNVRRAPLVVENVS
jgi:hypothetical protein